MGLERNRSDEKISSCRSEIIICKFIFVSITDHCEAKDGILNESLSSSSLESVYIYFLGNDCPTLILRENCYTFYKLHNQPRVTVFL